MKDRFERLHEENQQVFLPQNPTEILRHGEQDRGRGRGTSQPRDLTHVSCLTGGFFIPESPRKLKDTSSIISTFWLLQRILV